MSVKCLANGLEVNYPCSPSCALFGDCVTAFESQKKENVRTNADRIREMSDNDLGKFLLSCCDWNLLVENVCDEDNCAECHDEISTCTGNCLPAVVKWLQQPAEED